MAADKKFTDSGIEINKLYLSGDVPKAPSLENFEEVPGQFPYTRGVQADMYRGRLWTMSQYAGFSTAE